MRSYRTSGARLMILLLFGTIIAMLFAIAKDSLKVLLAVEGLFLVLAFLAWAKAEIHFEGTSIVQSSFFLLRTSRPISTIRRMRFDREEDNFGMPTTYVTIEFLDGGKFVLFDLSDSALREIATRISAILPDVIDPTVRAHLDVATSGKASRTVLRPGDPFLFISAFILALLFISWWLFQRYWIS